jgi:hypothetical protein
MSDPSQANERTSERQQAWRLHGRAMALLAALAAAATLVDQAFQIGRAAWFSLESFLTYAVWAAFAANAVLTTVLVAIFAQRRATALAIDLGGPGVLLLSSLLWMGSQFPRPAASGDPPVLAGPAVPSAAAACLTSLDRWSWSEPERFSARVELDVTTPSPVTVNVYAQAAGNNEILLNMPKEASHELPAGRSSLSLELRRFQPGRPTRWEVTFSCIKPRAFVRYESGAIEHVDRWALVRGLPAAAAMPPPPTPSAADYDLFVWVNDRPGFLLRRASEEPLDSTWKLGRKIQSPMEALPEALARVGHGTVVWWPTPDAPDTAQVTTIQAACRKAGVSLVMPSHFLPSRTERHDDPVAPASD